MSATSFATIIPAEAETIVLIAQLLQSQFNLDKGRGVIYNQDFTMPTDDRMCYTVAIIGDHPFGSSKRHVDDPELGLVEVIGTQVQEMIQLLIYSEGPEARIRRHEVMMMLKSDEAEQIQEKYSFQIGTLPTSFVDVSRTDGAHRLNRYAITFNVLRAYQRTRAVECFNTPDAPALIIEP